MSLKLTVKWWAYKYLIQHGCQTNLKSGACKQLKLTQIKKKLTLNRAALTGRIVTLISSACHFKYCWITIETVFLRSAIMKQSIPLHNFPLWLRPTMVPLTNSWDFCEILASNIEFTSYLILPSLLRIFCPSSESMLIFTYSKALILFWHENRLLMC